MGARRIFAALAVLALAVLVTAGAAVANDLNAPGTDHGWPGKDPVNQGTGSGGTSAGGAQGSGSGGVAQGGSSGSQGDGSRGHGQGHSDDVGSADSGSGSGSSSSAGSGGVTGSGAGISSAPVEAPAAAASGPAPDAAAAAPDPVPDPVPVADTFVASGPTEGTGGAGAAVSDVAPTVVAEAAPVVPANDLQGLGDLRVLGSIGAIANRVTDGPAAARALLATGTGRSLAVICGLLVAIALFLAVHRRADRGDRKLAAARSGPDVARFR